jgi:hypothetical protein
VATVPAAPVAGAALPMPQVSIPQVSIPPALLTAIRTAHDLPPSTQPPTPAPLVAQAQAALRRALSSPPRSPKAADFWTLVDKAPTQTWPSTPAWSTPTPSAGGQTRLVLGMEGPRDIVGDLENRWFTLTDFAVELSQMSPVERGMVLAVNHLQLRAHTRADWIGSLYALFHTTRLDPLPSDMRARLLGQLSTAPTLTFAQRLDATMELNTLRGLMFHHPQT